MGFSIVPSLEPKGPRREGVVARPLEDPAVDFPIYAVWRRTSAGNPLLAAVLEHAPAGPELHSFPETIPPRPGKRTAGSRST